MEARRGHGSRDSRGRTLRHGAVTFRRLYASACLVTIVAIGSVVTTAAPARAAAAPPTWTVVPSPSLGLSGISCTSASWCVAVGNESIEHFNGVGWTIDSTPLTDLVDYLLSVSCASPTFCVAVGPSRRQWPRSEPD